MRAATTTARRLATALATVVAVLACAGAAQADDDAFGVVPDSFTAAVSSTRPAPTPT